MIKEEFCIITVNYYSTQLINEMERVLAQVGCDLVVVDNSGEFVAFSRETKIIRPGTNIGFGRACNMAARKVSAKILLLLNPDTSVDPSTIENCFLCAAGLPRAIVGPLILNSGGEYVELREGGVFGLSYARVKCDLGSIGSELFRVVYVSGACLAIHRKYFLELGGFDEEVFLYGEDLDLCRRVYRSGGLCLCNPNLRIGHIGGGSGGGLNVKLRRLWRSFWGHYTVLRKDMSLVGAAFNAFHLASGRRI